MGTGGSLRLLSPEILGCLGFGSARVVPPSPASRSLAFRFPRTLKTAQARFHALRLTMASFATRFNILLTNPSGLGFGSGLGCFCARFRVSRCLCIALRFLYCLLPIPFCLFSDQALDLLVSSSSIRCRTSTDDLSTLSSSRGLTCSRSGNSLLWVGFTLRCLQRLSLPHFASLLCTWQYNSCTRGASIPVLSY